MKLEKDNNSLSLIYKNHIVFCHKKSTTFASALDFKVLYKSSRGSFTTKEKKNKITNLYSYKIINESNESIIIEFFNDDKTLNVSFTEKECYLEILFKPSWQSGIAIRTMASNDEAIFGGGEQFRKLNLKGEKVTNFVSEHSNLSSLIEKTIFGKLYKEKSHKDIKTYAPMSTFVSSKLYGIRFDVSCYGVSDFSHKEYNKFYFLECPTKMIFVKEDSFKKIGMAFAKNIPNNEAIPEWAYDGMILGVQGGIDIASKKAIAMQNMGAKICGIWCQDWSGQKVTAVGKQVYWNWTMDTERYHDLKENITNLKKKGIHFLAYINPYLVENSDLYNFCKNNNYLIKKTDGSIYHIKSTTFDAGMLDLTNPQTVKFIKDILINKNMLSLGIDGYMADFGEYLPVDSVLFNGNAEALHNEWPVMWSKLNREAIIESGREKEILFFTRAAYNGAQRYTTMMWNGDQHTDWSFDYGFPTVLPACFSLGFSGVTISHSDVGGFFSFLKMTRDANLYIRWAEMCAFSPLMRGHESLRPDQNAQYDDIEIAPYMVKLTKAHAALKPYIKNLLHDANNGIMMMRPDFFDSSDFLQHKDQYSYMLGSDIFVAPVIEKNATTRDVFLPRGTWTRFFTNEEYSSGFHCVDAPLGQAVAFFKNDSQFYNLFRSFSQF